MSSFRIYLPARNSYDDDRPSNSLDILNRYIEAEFPGVNDTSNQSKIYAVPKNFGNDHLELQALRSEQIVYDRLKNLDVPGLWCVFFQGRTYGGVSYRNERHGKIMIREHDFVVLASFKGTRYAALIEVKSTCDEANTNALKISDAKMVKNNKRSAQHQLRDHLEMISQEIEPENSNRQQAIQSYIFWPFLSCKTRNPQKQEIERWKDDGKLHAFRDVFLTQTSFDDWFLQNILKPKDQISDNNWLKLLQRFIILSCGVFVEELDTGLLALLTQDQLDLLYRTPIHNGRPLIIHGAAGTGKTLLILQKLKQLHEEGELNGGSRALYICYWPGIRCDVSQKLEKLGISDYVDTTRFFIAMDGFLLKNKNKYRHVFMDESEAICLAFNENIIRDTFERINNIRDDPDGCLWFLVDINQAAIFLPKHSPNILKKPDIILRKVIRSTKNIYQMFHKFYTDPFPSLPSALKQIAYTRIENIEIGHDISGLPIYWSESSQSDQNISVVTRIVIDLCTTKGIKANDIAVFPFLITNQYLQDNVNKEIEKHFVENGFMPQAMCNVENFLMNRKNYHFLIPWALRAKGLEFKVVVLAVEDDDIDFTDSEDRRKLYIMSSRCTCMLILVSSPYVKSFIDDTNSMLNYPFSKSLNWSS